MSKFTSFVLMSGVVTIVFASSGCASSSGVASRDPATDPFPWCAGQRADAAERMPRQGSTPEELEAQQRYVDAHVDKGCQTDMPLTHP